MKLKIRKSSIDDLDDLVPLLDGYRVFYGQESNQAAARLFLEERYLKNDSLIFIVESDGMVVGFTQLYPIFSTVSLERMMLLNDLYVDPSNRSSGIGEALLRYAQSHIKVTGQKGLMLQTGLDNPAQRLYERLGWQKETDLFYFWKSEM